MVYELHPNIAGKTTTLPCYMTVEFTLERAESLTGKKKGLIPYPTSPFPPGIQLIKPSHYSNVKGFFYKNDCTSFRDYIILSR